MDPHLAEFKDAEPEPFETNYLTRWGMECSALFKVTSIVDRSELSMTTNGETIVIRLCTGAEGSNLCNPAYKPSTPNEEEDEKVNGA